MAFQKGHPYGKRFNGQPGPGRPKSIEKQWKEKIAKVMNDMRLERISAADLKELQALGVQMAKGGSFDHYKFIMEREEQYANVELPKIGKLENVPKIALKVGDEMLKNALTPKKAKEITEVLKNISELNLSAEVERLEDMTGKDN